MNVLKVLLKGELYNIKTFKYDQFIIGRRPVTSTWGVFARDTQDGKYKLITIFTLSFSEAEYLVSRILDTTGILETEGGKNE